MAVYTFTIRPIDSAGLAVAVVSAGLPACSCDPYVSGNVICVPFTDDLTTQQQQTLTTLVSSYVVPPKPAPVVASPINFGGHVSASPTIVAVGITVITGHWLATWTSMPAPAGGPLTAMGRGQSVTLTGGTTDSLILALDNSGNLTLRKIGLRDYLVSLNLFGR